MGLSVYCNLVDHQSKFLLYCSLLVLLIARHLTIRAFTFIIRESYLMNYMQNNFKALILQTYRYDNDIQKYRYDNDIQKYRYDNDIQKYRYDNDIQKLMEVRLVVLFVNTIFNNISVLLVGETGVSCENHRPATSH